MTSKAQVVDNIMDSVINKLRNTVTSVTSTVSQLSVVLPGNPVTREYEISQQIASAGPGLLWKIYSGHKKSTKQEASIFIFEKKQLDKWSRKDRETMIEILKKGIQQITKLKHPKILTVQYALEESRDSLAFASEPIFTSLANVLEAGNSSSCSSTENVNTAGKKYQLHDMEIKHGLLQICEGLTFLHRDAKILHGNLCPESIIINESGAWKIFGLDFCNYAVMGGNNECNWACKEYEPDGHELTQQNLDYLAPEYSSSSSCSPSSDMFSLGLLAFTAFNKGDPLIHSNGTWHKHKQHLLRFNTLSDAELKCIPPEMRSFEKNLLSPNPTSRPDSHEFSKLECLRDEGVRTLIFLDSLFQLDNLQKSKFYKGLGEILPKLPQRIRLQRVVPSLAQEFVNPTMVPFVLPNVLKIAEWSTNEEFVKHILPHLRIVLKLREPVQILFIFMKYMELLLQKTPPDITKSDVLPLIYGSLESDSTQVQELCLSIIPSFAALIDFPAMKNSLLPRIKKLCLSTQSLSVRVNCLVCLGKILDQLDKWLVIDFVLPFLAEIPSREPAVVMGIIGIIKLATTHKKLGLPKEIIASKVLPFLFPLTIENGLKLQQFTVIMTFIYELIKIVETEQKSKLEEVSAIAKEQSKTEFHPDQMNSAEGGSAAASAVDFNATFDDFFLSAPDSSSLQKSISSSAGFGDSSTSHYNNNNLQQSSKSPLPTSKPMQLRPSHSQSSGSLKSADVPKDLTSTLINSNLNQMKYNTPAAVQPSPAFASNQQQQWSQPGAGTVSSSTSTPRYNYPLQSSSSFQQTHNVNPTTQNVPSATGMPLSMSMSNMRNGGVSTGGPSSSSWMSSAAGGGGTGQQQQQFTTPTVNYNFNSSSSSPYTPAGGGGASASMNLLTLGNTNHNRSKNTTNNNSKILSKQEIDDFLSFNK